jgi:hypothetical protein
MLTLNPGESITLTVRKHWLVFIAEVGGVVIALLGALGILAFINIALFSTAESTAGAFHLIAINIAALSVIFMVAIMLFAVFFTTYYLDVVVVTNCRVIDFEQKHIFTRDIATIPIGNVTDIKVEIAGLLQTFLKYGTIHVQTAGTIKEMHIRGITDPHALKTAIMEARVRSAGVQIPPSIPPPASPTEH